MSIYNIYINFIILIQIIYIRGLLFLFFLLKLNMSNILFLVTTIAVLYVVHLYLEPLLYLDSAKIHDQFGQL